MKLYRVNKTKALQYIVPGHAIDDDVYKSLEHVVSVCDVNKLQYFENVTGSTKTLFAPEGFVAELMPDADFHNALYRHLFRGIAYAQVSLARVKDEVLASKRELMCGMELELGEFAWAGLYRLINKDLKETFAVVVVGGCCVDKKTLYELCKNTNAEAIPKLEPFREKSVQLRRNALQQLASLFDTSFVGDVVDVEFAGFHGMNYRSHVAYGVQANGPLDDISLFEDSNELIACQSFPCSTGETESDDEIACRAVVVVKHSQIHKTGRTALLKPVLIQISATQ